MNRTEYEEKMKALYEKFKSHDEQADEAVARAQMAREDAEVEVHKMEESIKEMSALKETYRGSWLDEWDKLWEQETKEE